MVRAVAGLARYFCQPVDAYRAGPDDSRRLNELHGALLRGDILCKLSDAARRGGVAWCRRADDGERGGGGSRGDRAAFWRDCWSAQDGMRSRFAPGGRSRFSRWIRRMVPSSCRRETSRIQHRRRGWTGVLVATKTYDAEGAKLWLKGLCGPQTKIAIVQNGVEHREHFPSWTVLPVVIDVPAERVAEGRVLQRSGAIMRVEAGQAGSAFADLFAGSGAEVDVTPDFLSAAWRKLCINAAGAVSALTMQPAGVLREEEMGRIALDLVSECVAVGRVVGAKLEDGIPERVLAGARAGSPDAINSLLADRKAGRQTEVEARNGVIVRLGELYQIPTPANLLSDCTAQSESLLIPFSLKQARAYGSHV